MTKQEEIEILRDAIGKLGSESYIGPWLAGQLPIIESFMKSDLPIDLDIGQTVRVATAEADATIADATRQAERIVEIATTRAKRITDTAHEYRAAIIGQLRHCIGTLGGSV